MPWSERAEAEVLAGEVAEVSSENQKLTTWLKVREGTTNVSGSVGYGYGGHRHGQGRRGGRQIVHTDIILGKAGLEDTYWENLHFCLTAIWRQLCPN